MSEHQLPLAGTRVLDQTIIWAGPYASMILGDLGAEVIRVESVQHFAFQTRGYTPHPTEEMVPSLGILGGGYVDSDPGEKPWNRYAVFNVTGRNKLSVTADLSRLEGVEIFKRLAAISDVVIDNSSYGVLGRLGLGYQELRKVRPDIICVSLPIFGNSGPYKQIAATGGAAEALSGMSSLHGYRNSEINETLGVLHMDAATGPGAAFAVLCALQYRKETGKGQFIDMSQFENMLAHTAELSLDAQMNGRIPEKLGNRDYWGGLQGCYPCKRGTWVVLTVRDDADWARLQQALGAPPWTKDEKFATAPSRFQHHDEFDIHMGEWTSRHTDNQAMKILQKAGLPASKVADERAAYRDRHMKAREFFIPTDHPDSGSHPYPGHLWKYQGTPLRAGSPAPGLGQHNALIYKELLGYNDGEYDRLVKEKHIGDEYL